MSAIDPAHAGSFNQIPSMRHQPWTFAQDVDLKGVAVAVEDATEINWGDPLTGPPSGKSYWLEIVAVVPSNFVIWMVNGSL